MHDKQREVVVEELMTLITLGNAHVSLDDSIAGLPQNLRTAIPENLPYSIWQLLDHIRITQWDIVEFCISEDHKSPQWPEGYWSENKAEILDEEWEDCISQIHKDRERFFQLLKNKDLDLYAPFPYGDGQHIFREALLIADHTSYHLGEILVLRRLLNAWK